MNRPAEISGGPEAVSVYTRLVAKATNSTIANRMACDTVPALLAIAEP